MMTDDEMRRNHLQAWYRTMCRVLGQPPSPESLLLPPYQLERLCRSLEQQQEQRYQAMRSSRMRRRRTRR